LRFHHLVQLFLGMWRGKWPWWVACGGQNLCTLWGLKREKTEKRDTHTERRLAKYRIPAFTHAPGNLLPPTRLHLLRFPHFPVAINGQIKLMRWEPSCSTYCRKVNTLNTTGLFKIRSICIYKITHKVQIM
jgi:hypothetical protein